MTEEIELKINVGEGKYTFISYKNDFRIYCLRYGESWMIFEKGHKAISSLMYDYQAVLEISTRVIERKSNG